jgi:osmotically-inducible protein OsmY
MATKRHTAQAPFTALLALPLLVGLAGTPVYAVEPPADAQVMYSNEWLKARLMTAYTLNRHLDPYTLRVDVQDGVATISGRVDNAVEHDLAIEIAKGVEGIREVEDRIRVQPMLAESSPELTDEERSGFAIQVSDATITASVKMRLLWNRHTDGLDIAVTTHRGAVTLEGVVDDAVKRDLAGEIAANTHDVRAVDNRLRIMAGSGPTVGQKVGKAVDKAGAVLSDTWITTKVNAVLGNSDEVDSTEIKVSTKDGVVTLDGRVASAFERTRAPEIVADVVGVRQVENRLSISERLSQGG